MQELSDCDWDNIFEHCDSHSTMVDTFIEFCYNVCKKYVPEKKAKQRNTKIIKIPRYRRNLMRRRNKIKKQLTKKKVTTRRRTKLKHELVEIELSLKKEQNKKTLQYQLLEKIASTSMLMQKSSQKYAKV